MDKSTQDMITLVNTLIKFNDNIPCILEFMPDSKWDVELLMPYIDYEIKKTLKDIIHNEKL